MCGMMHAMMMEKTVLPASDGGVIIVIGNKILKYDKNLELKKEAEIKMDFESLQKMISEMKEKCPHCKAMKAAPEAPTPEKAAEEPKK